MKRTTAQSRLCLYMAPWRADQYDTDSTTLQLDILRVSPHDEKPRNCSRNGDAGDQRIFADLKLACYCTWGYDKFTADSWDTRYSGYMIPDVADLRTMLEGPKTFGQYAVLMAHALGVKECCRPREGASGAFYTDSLWQYLPISYAQDWIDEEIQRIVRTRCPQYAPAIAA